ncbi:hypothetical protein V5O48_009341 [Marasmius crinis-equi]|uniref:Uncharacterized protein n=1 Tax=Marasmius crinis-equi TaxID=585013 RepID=A0ABR3FBI7_9AGAR
MSSHQIFAVPAENGKYLDVRFILPEAEYAEGDGVLEKRLVTLAVDPNDLARSFALKSIRLYFLDQNDNPPPALQPSALQPPSPSSQTESDWHASDIVNGFPSSMSEPAQRRLLFGISMFRPQDRPLLRDIANRHGWTLNTQLASPSAAIHTSHKTRPAENDITAVNSSPQVPMSQNKRPRTPPSIQEVPAEKLTADTSPSTQEWTNILNDINLDKLRRGSTTPESMRKFMEMNDILDELGQSHPRKLRRLTDQPVSPVSPTVRTRNLLTPENLLAHNMVASISTPKTRQKRAEDDLPAACSDDLATVPASLSDEQGYNLCGLPSFLDLTLEWLLIFNGAVVLPEQHAAGFDGLGFL